MRRDEETPSSCSRFRHQRLRNSRYRLQILDTRMGLLLIIVLPATCLVEKLSCTHMINRIYHHITQVTRESLLSGVTMICKYKKRLLLRCIHHFKSDRINHMDHMRISGIEPSSVILSQTKLFENIESVVPNVSKKQKAKRLFESWMLQTMGTRMGFYCPFRNMMIGYFLPVLNLL